MTTDNEPRPTGAELASTLERLHSEWHRIDAESRDIYARMTQDRDSLKALEDERKAIEDQLVTLIRPSSVIWEWDWWIRP
jgi:hypothetical protein